MSTSAKAPETAAEDEIARLLLPPIDATLLTSEPFVDEKSYWDLVDAWFRARLLVLRFRGSAGPYLSGEVGSDAATRKTVVEAVHRAGREASGTLPDGLRQLPLVLALRAQAEERFETVRSALSERRRATPEAYPAPRILRLAGRVGLQERELEILQLLVVSAFANESLTRGGPDAGDVGELLDLDPETFVGIFDETRPLRRLGFVQVERDILGWPRSRDLRIDLPLVKALRGLPLSPPDHFALSEESIRAVLSEEPGATAFVAVPALEPDTQRPPEEVEDFAEEAIDAEAEPPEVAPLEETLPGSLEPATPFLDDLEYLSEHMEWFQARLRWKKLIVEEEEESFSPRSDRSPAARKREASARERVAAARLRQRVESTVRQGRFVPRGEELARSRSLAPFEKHSLLLLACFGLKLSFAKLFNSYGRGVDVGELIALLCDSDREQRDARKHFYRDAPLVREGLVVLSGSDFDGDVLRRDVTIDRRMAEYLLGLDTESVSLVEGSHIYTPRVDLDRVVLAEAKKKLIVDTVVGFPAFRRACSESGLDSILSYGSGQVLLFHGASGTGKTMLANALASHLGKRVLLVNFPTIGQMTSDQALRFLFREARVHDAILFFDECDGIFEDREKNPGISLILTEIERHDGLIIMATNRALKLDEAMFRRITLAIEFQVPDASQREQIWKSHLPANLKAEGALDVTGLARRYELTGGFIKNAVLAAVSLAAARDPAQPVVRPEDLEQGARLQLQNRLRMTSFSDRVVPQEGLSAMVLPSQVRESLTDLVALERARRTLVSEWGFEKEAERGFGAGALFHGPSGTGKSLAAEAVAWELGRPLKRVNVAQLVSKWVGEGAKNIHNLFAEAREHEAILVFDEADALFAARTPVGSATDRYANLDVAVLLSEMERFGGVVILTTNLPDHVDPAFRRRLRFVVEFPVPDAAGRADLWRKLLPARTPVRLPLDFEELGRDFALTGAQIRNAVIRAASRAALQEGDARCVAQEDLRMAALEEGRGNGHARSIGFLSMPGGNFAAVQAPPSPTVQESR